MTVNFVLIYFTQMFVLLCVHMHYQLVTLRRSSVVVLVNASLCVNVVMVNATAQTAVMSTIAVSYTLTV